MLGAIVYLWRAIDFDRRFHGPYLVDDAYISLRHALNFVQGHGLNYNPGERVEGYTNFLYTLLMSLAFPLGISPEGWIKGIGIAAGAALVGAIYLISRPLLGRPAAALLSLVAAFDPRLAEFSTWGLEIVFCPMLYAWAFHQLFRDRSKSAALLFALAAMTRIETVMLAVIGFGYLLLVDLFPAQGRKSWSPASLLTDLKRPAVFALIFNGIFGTYFVSRYLYYGQLFPNTYYAKVGRAADSFDRGVAYVSEMLGRMGLLELGRAALYVLPVALLILLAQSLWTKGFAKERAQELILLLAGALYIAYIVRVGGDHFRERFIYHAYPLVLIGIPLSLTVVARLVVSWIPPTFLKASLRTRCAAVGLLAVAMTSDAVARVPTPEFGSTPPGWALAGKWIGERSEPDDWLATCAAGILPYASGQPTIDMLGLSDLHIAHLKPEEVGKGVAGHEKSDPYYVLSREPRFITTWLGADGGADRGLQGIFEFRSNYRLAAVVRSSGGQAPLIEVDESTSMSEILERQSKGYNWGIWERRVEGPRKELRHHELSSQLIDPIPPPVDGILLDAPKGHEQTHILYGPYVGFNPGEYQWELDLELMDQDFTGELCRFEANRNFPDGSRFMFQNEPILGDQLQGGIQTVRAAFGVEEGERENNFSMGLFCHGLAHVRVHSLRVVGM